MQIRNRQIQASLHITLSFSFRRVLFSTEQLTVEAQELCLTSTARSTCQHANEQIVQRIYPIVYLAGPVPYPTAPVETARCCRGHIHTAWHIHGKKAKPKSPKFLSGERQKSSRRRWAVSLRVPPETKTAVALAAARSRHVRYPVKSPAPPPAHSHSILTLQTKLLHPIAKAGKGKYG
jgi:hypothetical protein